MKDVRIRVVVFICILVVLAWDLLAGVGRAAPAVTLSKGQLVYVPAYSHVYYGDIERKFLLTAVLSIRNTDPDHAITLVLVDYYDSDGKLIKNYLAKPLTLKPMASKRFIVKESDTRGGSGANFLVKWQAETAVNEPIMESVMIGTAMGQGISFTSRGKVLKNK